MASLEEEAMLGPSGTPHCGLCGVLWSAHELDPTPGPTGMKTWVCRLSAERFDTLLNFMEDESNWPKKEF